jgi:hypothetical protein
MSLLLLHNKLEEPMSPSRLLVASQNLALCLAVCVGFSGCNSNPTPPQQPSMRTFASPEEAGAAIDEVVKAGDTDAIAPIFGPGSKEVILSGDSVADKNAGDAFARRYAQMHRWRLMPDGAMMLLIGADNFPFAVPLKKNDAGQWYFDLAAGKD